MSTGDSRLLSLIRNGQEMTLAQQIALTFHLSTPAILAQLSVILMQYIDASMVGSLGAEPAASIGLMSTTTWLLGGLCSAAAMGFSVQVAHHIGAKDYAAARAVLRQSMITVFSFALLLSVVGFAISGHLPVWLGGNEHITADATAYFKIYSLSLPAFQLCLLGSSMLRCCGNMKVPSLLNVMMCLLDVLFNYLFIFPTRIVYVLEIPFYVPGAGMGVAGAALGTALAILITSVLMLYFSCFKTKELNLSLDSGRFLPTVSILRRALHIGAPIGGEHIVICGAQIMSTMIVAPLGTIAIAANAFAITAESLCYMPGFGIADAATTLVGQCVGAGRKSLAKRFANITVFSGIAVMTFMGIIMFVCAPVMIGIMTPDCDIVNLGVRVLRIEAFAEPMFAASIVAYGAFVGTGDTLVPSIMNFVSIWAVRLTLAALLAPHYGLVGVWIAMCIELCFRGIIFLIRLYSGKWLNHTHLKEAAEGNR